MSATTAEQVTYNAPDGAVIGKTASDPISFHGATPVVQAAALVAVGTSVPVAACASFGLTSTQLTAAVTAINAIIVALQNKGITA
jgi:hypothetical protein